MINLNKETLTGVIKSMGNSGRIFQSEAQFQFDLSWELQKQLPNCRVKLEDMRSVIRNEKGEIKNKFYTDTVLEDGDYSIAIELKYKTAAPKEGYYDKEKGICLFNQGAVDEGRYDYLWDVHRLELLTGKGNNKELLFGKCGSEEAEAKWGHVEVLKGCNKGYAVLLTNEKDYWGKCHEDEKEDGSPTIDNQVKIGEKSKGETYKLFSKDLDWKHVEDKHTYNQYPSTVVTQNGNSTKRAQKIHLTKQYTYRWEDYCLLPPYGDFRFVIIEI